ncbi:carboxypeptidase-like regulatory domain-containing protein [Spirosoma aureum]|uniref:carboxypeptidase-like regulatory domain-containing protein n=1 Tax=Spirosoma aureum TaxID=2692134 RepID=UPI001E61B981|nr:carboxypeptidase-like regulatory domain-containing protein [Spirosoma aureum]
MQILSNARKLLFIGLCLTSYSLSAQTFTQTIRGTVMDQSLQTPLPGATVVVLNTSPLQGTSTDQSGQFQLTKIPVGRQTLQISAVGYKNSCCKTSPSMRAKNWCSASRWKKPSISYRK